MQSIGRYQIQGELGRGAMGIVYRALDPAIGRTLAIKTIRLAAFDDPRERGRMRERLFREAQSAGMLSHPNIVTIYDIAEEGENAYIFMEFVDGPTLHQKMTASDPPGAAWVLEMLRQCASGLDYAHRKGIVHRDIKPANIMIAEDGQAKITDFGIARIDSQQLTQSGMILGTPNYMSPEQFAGTPPTGRADQFSLAVIIYELLTGERPFVADSLATLMYRIIREGATPPHRINATLAPDVDAVIERAMAKDAADRFPTCTDFVAALTQACNATPAWHPMATGAAHSLPTVLDPRPATSTLSGSKETPTVAVAPPALDPPAPPPPPLPAPTGSGTLRPATLEELPPPAIPQGPPTLPPAPIELPPPVRSSRDYQEPATAPGSGNLGRKLLLTAALTALVGSGSLYWFWTRARAADLQKRQQQELAQQQQQPQPSGASDKPSPNLPAAATGASGAGGEAPDSTTPAATGASGDTTTPVETPAGDTPAETPAKPPVKPPPVTAPVKPRPMDTRPPVSPRPPAASDLVMNVVTSPPGAKVVFDNNAAQTCNAPCNIPLTPGRHALAATADGYRTALRIFEMPKDKSLFVNLDKQLGTLRVTTEPAGATITLNGQRWAQPTPATITLAPGKYRIEMAHDGFQTYVDEVTVRDQAIGHLEVTLGRKQ